MIDTMTRQRPRKSRQPLLRFLKYHILHINDSPARIALGLAIGIQIAWTPIIGLHILITIVAATLLRANKIAALTSVWLSNIFTYVPMMYSSYLLGCLLRNIFRHEEILSRVEASVMFKETFSPSSMFTCLWSSRFWQSLFNLFKAIGPELWLGSLILGFLSALGGYLFCYNIIRIHRRKNPHRRFHKYSTDTKL